jgi:hypothetical protein
LLLFYIHSNILITEKDYLRRFSTSLYCQHCMGVLPDAENKILSLSS